MNILGLGPAELVMILLIMLVVAGPKRMAQWAYVAGQLFAQVRVMWQDMMGIVQEELQEAGMEPEVMDTLRKLSSNTRSLRGASRQLTQSVNEQTRKQLDQMFTPDAKPAKQESPPPQSGGNGAAAPEAPAESPLEPPAESPPADPPADESPKRYDAWTPK